MSDEVLLMVLGLSVLGSYGLALLLLEPDSQLASSEAFPGLWARWSPQR